ncbi:hypothetical protein K6W79_28290, partial [Burkholderia cepacia]|nr:hypothetical protein [Burkholderia cepacia]
MMADGVAVDGGTPGGCRARRAGEAGGHAGQDAHVNTSAARFSGAPPDGAARADPAAAPCPSGQSGPVRAAIGHNIPTRRRPAPNRLNRLNRLNRHRIDIMGYPFATAALGPLLFAQGRY